MPIYPNDLDIPPFQLRRAIATTVSNYVPAMGEPVWSTDGETLYIGDGTTVGGIAVGGVGFTATNATVSKLTNGSYEVALNSNGTVSFPFGGTLQAGNGAEFFIKNIDHPVSVQSIDTGTKVGALVAEMESATMYARDSSDGSNVEISTDNNDHANPVVRIKVQAAGGSTSTWTFNDDGTTAFPSFTFPYADGTSGQVLATNGTGTLAWTTISGGGSTSTFDTITVNDSISLGRYDGTPTGRIIATYNTTTQAYVVTNFGGGGGNNNISIGNYIGSGDNSTFVGHQAGMSNSLSDSVLLGYRAGKGLLNSSQNNNTIIGNIVSGNGAIQSSVSMSDTLLIAAGPDSTVNQRVRIGADRIILGKNGLDASVAANSIILNASGSTLTSANSGLFVDPIRNTTSTQILYYDTTTKEITYGTGSGVSGNPFNQTLNTNSNVLFNSVVTQDVVSAGGYPVDSNGLANILTSNTQSAAMVVSNYTAGLIPGIQVRGWGQNRPGTVTTATSATPAFTMEGARGTPASPLPTGSLDTIFAVSGGGYDGFDWSNGRQLTPFQLIVQASENWTGNATTTTNAGTRFLIRTQPQGIQLDATSRQIHMFQTWNAGSTTAPPTANLLFGAGIDTTFPTLINSNGLNSHTGYGATNFTMVNTKNTIIGVPFEDAAVFTGSISSTTMTVTAVSSGVISVGQRIYSGTSNYGFINALGTATGGTGTYTLSTSSTVSSTTLNSGADNTTLNDSVTVTFGSGRKSGVSGRRNALKNGDTVGRFLFNGQTANGGTTSGSRAGQIAVRALEDFTGSVRGGRMTLSTTNSGTNTESTRLQLDNLNHYYNAAAHTFRNAAGSTSYMSLDTNGMQVGSGGADAFISAANAYNLTLRTNHTGDQGTITISSTGVALYGGTSGGSMTANFTTATSQIKTDQFEVVMQDNTQLITAANYGLRINNGYLYLGDPGEDGQIRTSDVGDDLTIQTNDGLTGGKIFLGEGDGSSVITYYQNTPIITASTGSVLLGAPLDISGQYIFGASSSEIDLFEPMIVVGDGSSTASIKTQGSHDLELATHANQPIAGGSILIQAGSPNGVKIKQNNNDVATFTTATITCNVPVTFPVYTVSSKPASGQVGQQICISDSASGGSSVNGMMAFWDTTNSRWSYVHSNNAV
jgi:hypothetical protein